VHDPNSPVTVFAILPARDEAANIADAVASLASQPELTEIIVVDDQSSDATPQILAALAARVPRLKILETQSLPPGWTGKNYAVSLGADFVLGNASEPRRPAARGNVWLLFTDADTRHLPGALPAALQIAGESAALVSFSPRQRTETFWERALIPIVYCRLALRFPFDRVNDPLLPDAAANGQYLMIRADAYEAIGGHAAMRGCVLEDVELARRIKGAGYRIWFQSGDGLVETRMYHSLSAMWQGWTKNLYLLLGGSGSAMLAELWVAVTVLLAGALLLAGLFVLVVIPPRASPLAAILCMAAALALVIVHARQGIALRRNHYPARFIQYYVPGVLLFGAALVASWWRNTRGAVTWKGRRYPVGKRNAK
jgi:glycosyltransferase involved in cell wall biosynthesis